MSLKRTAILVLERNYLLRMKILISWCPKILRRSKNCLAIQTRLLQTWHRKVMRLAKNFLMRRNGLVETTLWLRRVSRPACSCWSRAFGWMASLHFAIQGRLLPAFAGALSSVIASWSDGADPR